MSERKKKGMPLINSFSIITGAGDFYSSGTEFTIQNNESDPLDTVKDFIQAFIDYPKLLIAVVNGPAIGIAATTAALCDIVYCSDKAYFHTPFINLGLCAEGTSSFTYPAILGRSKASETILLGRKIPAKEAREFGLVSEVIPHRQLEGFIKNLYQYGQLPVNAVRLNKKLLMRNVRGALTESNNREIEDLRLCFQSEEFSKSMMTFLNKRKSKL
ncbi:hypothetical protein GWI33_011262 [Rhynchophorus ferrugineus]|uniref:Uncharacterized protein n=1 Tax=Rhynchophorus ferrugineus TaxID=354439 RepID=A0A834MDD2_RHYFE|nr:hypothetical protein GWI33_011262 [Rhynchophorus ferrugineus]